MLESLTTFLSALEPIVQQANGAPAFPEGDAPAMGAALAVGLAALGAGIAERGIGAAAVGAVAEDEELFATGLIFTVLPETLVILALVVVFVV